jgi:hypothetical protein
LEGGDHLRVSVAEDEGTPGKHIIYEAVPIYVEEICSLAALDEERLAAYGTEGTHGRIDPAREEVLSLAKELRRAISMHGWFSFPVQQYQAQEKRTAYEFKS